MDKYEKFEEECEKIRAENNNILDEFKQLLIDSGLSKKTINKHVSNVDFYINDYLLYDDVFEATDGVNFLDSFFTSFFPYKCLWSTPSSVRSMAASLKKFYGFMLNKNQVEQDDYDCLCDEIKEQIDEWAEASEGFQENDDWF